MIKIELTVDYPDMTEAEQEQLRAALRKEMLPAVFRAAATVPREEGKPEYFLLSTKLIVDGEVKIV